MELLDQASHNLKAPTEADRVGLSGPLVKTAVPTIADWLDSTLK